MELDLSGHRALLIYLAASMLLLGLGWLGHASLPSGDKFLTHTEWQFIKADRAYRRELSQLQAAAETLAGLVNERPDPVRAQLVAEGVRRLSSQGQAALLYQRGKLMDAAQAVSDWAVGAIEHEEARQVLEEAIKSLFPGEYPLTIPLSFGNPQPGKARR